MPLINIESYPVAHAKNGESGGKTVIYMNGGGNNNISNFTDINANTIKADEGNFIYIQAQEGKIIRLTGKELQYQYGYIGELKSDTIDTKSLKTEDLEAVKGWIKTLNSHEITTEYLTVTKQAHFFELVIDKIRSVGGQLIVTPANCTIDAAFAYTSNDVLIPEVTPENIDTVAYYKVYWRVENEVTHQKTTQEWIVNDQALCMSFNNVSQGTNYNVSNKYYWRLVKEVSSSPVYVNFSTGAIGASGGAVEKNEYVIQMNNTTCVMNGTARSNGIRWNAAVPSITGVITNVTWTDDSSLPSGKAISGTFKSASKTYGINIVPMASTSGLPNYITDTLDFTIKQLVSGSTYKAPSGINIGVYFEDDTFMTFNNVAINPETFACHLDLGHPNVAIEAIVITSSADVDWHQCHWMKLSNDTTTTDSLGRKECDDMLSGYASVPTAGDAIVQLGYRSADDNKVLSERDLEAQRRQSAIIIAAYQSIDKGGMLNGTQIPAIQTPSYAQYMGIYDFNLYKWRQSYFDANGAKFIGDITLCSFGNQSIEDVIQDIQDSITDSASDYLVPEKEVFMARLVSAVANNSTNTNLEIDLDYKIKHVDNSGAAIDKNFGTNTVRMKLYNNNKTQIGSTITIPVTGNDAGKYAQTNLLTVINSGTARPNDYLEMYAQFPDYTPVYAIVELVAQNQEVIDTRIVNVIVESGAVLKVTENEIHSIVSETVTEQLDEMQTQINQWSEIIQSAGDITMLVNQQIAQNDTIQGIVTEVQNLQSKIDMTAEQITLEVNRIINNSTELRSLIQQTSESITMSVLSGLVTDDNLKRTGIDITNGQISLDAENTYVNGNLNIIADGGFNVWNYDKTKSVQMRGTEIRKLDNYSWEGFKQYTWETGNKTKGTGNSFTVTYDNCGLGPFIANESINIFICPHISDPSGNKLVDTGPNRTISKVKITATLYASSDTNNQNPLISHSYEFNTSDKSLTRISNGVLQRTGYELCFNYTNTTARSIKCKVVVTYTGIGNKINESMTYNGMVNIVYDCHTKSTSVIALDGIALQGRPIEVDSNWSTPKSYMWWGQKQIGDRVDDDWIFQVRNTQNNFRVTGMGIQRTTYSNNSADPDYASIGTSSDTNLWHDIGSTSPVFIINNRDINIGSETIHGGQKLINLFGIFIMKGNTAKKSIILPDPANYIGRKLIMKCTGSGGINVKCHNGSTYVNKLMNCQDNGTAQTHDNIASQSIMYVSTGEYWVQFFCG